MRVLLERWSGLHWAAALLLAGLLVSARQAAWAAPEPQTLKGVVERFNYSPEGHYESAYYSRAPTSWGKSTSRSPWRRT